jgi:serine/threonine protein kinase
MYEVLVGQTPFVQGEDSAETESIDGVDTDNYHDIQIMNRIIKGTFKIPPHVSEEAADLIKQLLVIDPSKRLTSLRKILKHSWVMNHCGDTDLPSSKQGKKLYMEATKMAGVSKKRTQPDSVHSAEDGTTDIGTCAKGEKTVRRSARLSKRQRRSLSERDLEKEAFSKKQDEEGTSSTHQENHSDQPVHQRTLEATASSPHEKINSKHLPKNDGLSFTTKKVQLCSAQSKPSGVGGSSNASVTRRVGKPVSGPKRVPVKQNRVLSNTTNRQNAVTRVVTKATHNTGSMSKVSVDTSSRKVTSTSNRSGNVTVMSSRAKGVVRATKPITKKGGL